MIQKRVRKLNSLNYSNGFVVYWMSRDQRVSDNWALVYAQKIAYEKRSPLVVVFCLVPQFMGAAIRQYGFMLGGLENLQVNLAEKNISFNLLFGDPPVEIPRFIEEQNAGMLVCDFDPLRIKRNWKQEILNNIEIPFHEVDAHNIVPCFAASGKQEFAAHTIRRKINRLIPEYLEEFPEVKRHKFGQNEGVGGESGDSGERGKGKSVGIGLNNIKRKLKIDFKVPEVGWIKPGESSAANMLDFFIKNKLENYPERRNDPSADALSNLSPYLHFGQVSSQRAAFEVMNSGVVESAKEAFLEELIIRGELADNFCFYNDDYDSFSGFPDWAKKTLNEHRGDLREYIYTRDEFEGAKTHDELWNAAQLEMVKKGKMHGYMRMYWAKKILEWSETPESAMETAIYLNDKYELDGRDPKGYVGAAWSIGGVHDRAWAERNVFGKIRYMNYNGCKRKFNVDSYISMVDNL